MKAVLLAAGIGSRINKNRDAIPKPLYEIGNKCIIEHVVINLSQAGIKEFVVVVGFMADKIKEKLGDGSSYGVRIQYSFNPEYEKPLGLSLLAAERFVGGSFILSMSDHIVDSRGLKKIVDYDLVVDSCALLVDKKIDDIFWLDDSAKVKLDGENILGVDKQFDSYDAVDCGVFKCNKIIFELVRDTIEHPDSISRAVTNFCSQKKMFAVDIGEFKWIDIDEYSELEAAREIFRHLS